MAKIDEIRAQRWNQVVDFQRNLSANKIIASIYRKVISPMADAHAQIMALVGYVHGLSISPVTLAEAEDSVLNSGGRIFPNNAYKPNPVNYRSFRPFKPPILQQNWVLDNGENAPLIDTDLSVLKAGINPDITPGILQKSLNILQEFNTLSLSYLDNESKIKLVNLDSLTNLQSLIGLEKSSIIITGGEVTGTGAFATATPIVKSYNNEFLKAYQDYITTRSDALSKIADYLNSEASNINTFYYQWLEFYCHRTEGALSKYSMSQMSLDASKDALRLANDKYNIL